MICKVGLGWLLQRLWFSILWFSVGLMILFIRLSGVSCDYSIPIPSITDMSLVTIFIVAVTVIFFLPVRWFA